VDGAVVVVDVGSVVVLVAVVVVAVVPATPVERVGVGAVVPGPVPVAPSVEPEVVAAVMAVTGRSGGAEELPAGPVVDDGEAARPPRPGATTVVLVVVFGGRRAADLRSRWWWWSSAWDTAATSAMRARATARTAHQWGRPR